MDTDDDLPPIPSARGQLSSRDKSRNLEKPTEEDEEEDYMSTAFLDRLASRNPQRKPLNKRPPAPPQKLSAKSQEEAKRKQGLETALSTENKGFQLLAKMGYKPGKALGSTSSTTAAAALTEPIPISMHSGRSGIGVESTLKAKRKELEDHEIEEYQEHIALMDKRVDEFAHTAAAAFTRKRVAGDLRKAMIACEDLDRRGGKENGDDMYWWTRHVELQTWNKRQLQALTEDIPDTADKPAEYPFDSIENEEEKLRLVNEYLRHEYRYCIWCGCGYQNLEELERECPGDAYDDH
eukprot:Partr_v1_DN28290_c1_g1_i2_m75341 putative coiled-coil domain containing 75